LTQRVFVNRDPFQQWRQELIGIYVNPRRRLVPRGIRATIGQPITQIIHAKPIDSHL